MSTLSERALLVSLNTSQWTARKLDRGETTSLNRRHGLAVEAARVNKNLLPVGGELTYLQQVVGAIRKTFDQHTLPWGSDAMRILKSDTYMDFVQMARGWQDDWERARDAFLAAYPRMERDAAAALGPLYDPDDYPRGVDLQRKFKFDLRFMPIADENDWRIAVGDAERERLRADVRRHLQEVENAATASAWERIHDVVAKTVERLSDPANIFRDSLVENAVELCAVLPGLNLSGDPRMEEVRTTIERTLARYSGNVDALRHNPAAREDAADKMAEIMRKMAGYMPQKAA